MKRHTPITRRTRLRLALLAVLALLFQQAAFASYLCSIEDVPARHAAMSGHCDGMPMAERSAHAKTSPVLCVQHCAHQATSTQDARLPDVPPSLLPALLPAQPIVQALPMSRAQHAQVVAWRTSGIPPALRYRVLLI